MMFPAAENNAKYSLCHDSAITERTYNNNGQRNVFMPSVINFHINLLRSEESQMELFDFCRVSLNTSGLTLGSLHEFIH